MELCLAVSPGELTRAEQKILDYINTNTDAFLFSSIGQLARRLGLSDATVSRFARHVGCTDFKDLKSMVVEQASGPAAKMAGTLSQDGSFSPAAWLERQQLYLQKTAQQLDQAEFDRGVEALISARRIFLHGKNASASLARMLAFRLGRRWTQGPGDALMYGAGHGGAESFLLLGMTMVNNVILSLTINRGGLPAVEELIGPIPEAGMAAITSLAVTPAALYLWGAFERITAMVVQIALSVLVYAAVTRKSGWYWFPAPILLHAAVDVTAVAAGAFLPIPATEALLAAWAAALALLARRVYLQEKWKKS